MDHRVTSDDGNHFYLASIGDPPLGEWLVSLRVIMGAANLKVARYQDRHRAISERRQVMGWLSDTIAEDVLLVTPPASALLVSEVGAGRLTQGELAL